MGFIGRLVYAIISVLELLLVFRFIFRFLGANPSNEFVYFIYSASWPLIRPFISIFSSTNPVVGVPSSGAFETATVVAFVVYAIAGGLISQLFTAGHRHQV